MKMSRNQARKKAYYAQGNSASRNQDGIDGPIVGRLETVTEQVIYTLRDDGTEKAKRVRVAPFVRVVHDGDTSTAAPVRHRAKSSNPKANARRERAQARCAASGHKPANHKGNCARCGAPVKVKS